MREKPYTAGELFNVVTALIDKNGRKPDFLDYTLANNTDFALKNCDFSVSAEVMYGNSEGIYIDVYIRTYETGIINETGVISMGTIKCLYTDDDSFRKMGELAAEYVITTTNYVNNHMDDFEF